MANSNDDFSNANIQSMTDGVRIVRASELVRLSNLISTAVDALTRAPSTPKTANAIAELSEAHILIADVSMGENRVPPADVAERLETLSRII